MKANTPHPLFIMMAVVALGGALLTVKQRAPEFLPWIFVLAAIGMIYRVWAVQSEDAAARGEGQVDHEALRRMRLGDYGSWIKENVRGQDPTVDLIVHAIQRGLELARPGRSLGSFLLVGPTGTGKTFLAQMTAMALWPEKEPVVLRMNQFKDPQDLQGLLGVLGGADTGSLTGALLEDPCRVVLLDEIDKCHPDVLHGLFEALDGGRVRDRSSSKMVDFSGCVFFATCNAGAERLRALKAAAPAAFAAKARDTLIKDAGYEKAFLARFSEIVLMDALAPLHVAEIACLQIAKQWREQGIEVGYLSPELLAKAVALNSEFGEYGVRQLARCLRRLMDPLLEQARRQGTKVVSLGFDPAKGAAVLMLPSERA
ncbi:MAG: ATP-dependent Clp protease ATP-binding subunit [Elusimicrobia bacterium]|nr:ATP-dependent Clp protease ATP-binding subunit [Elusimicrobiota bacterium]